MSLLDQLLEKHGGAMDDDALDSLAGELVRIAGADEAAAAKALSSSLLSERKTVLRVGRYGLGALAGMVGVHGVAGGVDAAERLAVARGYPGISEIRRAAQDATVEAVAERAQFVADILIVVKALAHATPKVLLVLLGVL